MSPDSGAASGGQNKPQLQERQGGTRGRPAEEGEDGWMERKR
eukprot:CAMPEP_0177714636 /NCGR_PEP_ID=MMETSP0484_2-20121128/13559_1 /TAXON_ID=354590 /ORGANISM="Rhodomonas lens, Strain RHODO" /LENGTH=41 /DNA_ID= /DNA_START= /DNA_END= /DNA_ORIENTATION=